MEEVFGCDAHADCYEQPLCIIGAQMRAKIPKEDMPDTTCMNNSTDWRHHVPYRSQLQCVVGDVVGLFSTAGSLRRVKHNPQMYTELLNNGCNAKHLAAAAACSVLIPEHAAVCSLPSGMRPLQHLHLDIHWVSEHPNVFELAICSKQINLHSLNLKGVVVGLVHNAGPPVGEANILIQ